MQHFRQRRARGGHGLIPPNPRQWLNEHNGLDLREELGIPLEVALSHEDVYTLLPGVSIWPLTEIPVAKKYVDHFRGDGRSRWSGFAIELEGQHIGIYNDAHPFSRSRATLMEEFFHIRLNHPRSKVHLLSIDGTWRTHERGVEAEAFGSGAAALVPYKPLKTMVQAGCTVSDIARAFEVSKELVIFRAKVTRLYRFLTRRKRARADFRTVTGLAS
jgi:hypothetical protein